MRSMVWWEHVLAPGKVTDVRTGYEYRGNKLRGRGMSHGLLVLASRYEAWSLVMIRVTVMPTVTAEREEQVDRIEYDESSDVVPWHVMTMVHMVVED